jgi:hypothetical protein
MYRGRQGLLDFFLGGDADAERKREISEEEALEQSMQVF